MLNNCKKVLVIAKAFELWLSILQSLFLNRNDALRNIYKHILSTIFPVLSSFGEEDGCSVDCSLSYDIDSSKQDILVFFNFLLDS